MKIQDIVAAPRAGLEEEQGAKIPWDEPGFSQRMLEQHLEQGHDWASRRSGLIDRHVAWIAQQLPAPANILDLGCGPGFYAQRLADLGYRCVGVDFSPASVAYARQRAASRDGKPEYILPEYTLEDIRSFASKERFDGLLMTFGEFNVFSVADAEQLLSRCASLLRPGGLFVLEAHTLEAVRDAGLAPPSWQRQERGLFSEKPHLWLQENFWNDKKFTAISRHYIVDAASGEVDLYRSSLQGYPEDAYDAMLDAAGFTVVDAPDGNAWPPGGDFEGKLRVYARRKRG